MRLPRECHEIAKRSLGYFLRDQIAVILLSDHRQIVIRLKGGGHILLESEKPAPITSGGWAWGTILVKNTTNDP